METYLLLINGYEGVERLIFVSYDKDLIKKRYDEELENNKSYKILYDEKRQ